MMGHKHNLLNIKFRVILYNTQNCTKLPIVQCLLHLFSTTEYCINIVLLQFVYYSIDISAVIVTLVKKWYI